VLVIEKSGKREYFCLNFHLFAIWVRVSMCWFTTLLKTKKLRSIILANLVLSKEISCKTLHFPMLSIGMGPILLGHWAKCDFSAVLLRNGT
jgi:hypothetical protein